jgi:hypothetical protein
MAQTNTRLEQTKNYLHLNARVDPEGLYKTSTCDHHSIYHSSATLRNAIATRPQAIRDLLVDPTHASYCRKLPPLTSA